MPRIRYIKRRNLIRHLKLLGFEGLYSGGKQQASLQSRLASRLRQSYHTVTAPIIEKNK
ncbi:MAG TPA: type II toxin-antitoxin system HicA family toxin [Candidatus Methanoperedenaceae archaeon]|nr:MAG: type II toxin-antitoxin system HicA family toxin [Methanosarcinales archaeon]HHI30808.1 type II toxin-antitoxin system HicA family toxin [Candidatus Methanoperedenaceae archaeon]